MMGERKWQEDAVEAAGNRVSQHTWSDFLIENM